MPQQTRIHVYYNSVLLGPVRSQLTLRDLFDILKVDVSQGAFKLVPVVTSVTTSKKPRQHTLRDLDATVSSGVWEVVRDTGITADEEADKLKTVWDRRVEYFKRSLGDLRSEMEEEASVVGEHHVQENEILPAQSHDDAPIHRPNNFNSSQRTRYRYTSNTKPTVPTQSTLETSVTDILNILSALGDHPPHLPSPPKINTALNELMLLTKMLDEMRPKRWKSKVKALPMLRKDTRTLSGENKETPSIETQDSLQKGWQKHTTKHIQDTIKKIKSIDNLTEVAGKEDARIEGEVQTTKNSVQEKQTILQEPTKPEIADSPDQPEDPQYTLILYHTLHTLIQLHKSLTSCPRSGTKYFHIQDVSTLERLKRAEGILSTFHIWRRMLRLNKQIERRKSPLSSYKVLPTYLFRRINVHSPPKELGLSPDEREKKFPDIDKTYKKFKLEFLKNWSQCRVHSNAELNTLLDLMLDQEEEKWKKHGCFERFVFPKRSVRERILGDFGIYPEVLASK